MACFWGDDLMKWMTFFVMLCALCLVGCGDTGGSVGDSNDPAATGGSDEEQMDEETGDMSEGVDEE